MQQQTNRKSQLKLKKTNKSFPTRLIEVEVEEKEERQEGRPYRIKVFRSRRFIVQVFEDGDVIRLSVSRSEAKKDGSWKENITWEDLQQLKRQAGFGDRYAIEVYPRDIDLVNVANMRHIWVLEKPMKIGWRKSFEKKQKLDVCQK